MNPIYVAYEVFNKEEEQYLTSESGQNAISSSILRAFIEFKTELEKEN